MKHQQNEEFRLLLKSLHLEMKQLADFWGLNVRSVKRWASGEEPLPTKRREALLEWQRWAEQSAQALVSRAMTDYANYSKPKCINFLIYNQGDFAELVSVDEPTQVHHSAIARAKFLLELQGFKIKIVKFSRQVFDDWRGESPDTSDLRALWASEQ